MRTICLLGLVALISLTQTKDISGTWVAKRQTPNGEMELVYELKVADGKITGTQKMQFGDSPIIDGKIDGDQFEFTVEMGSSGNLQKRVVTGKIVGDELHFVPAMPGPPPGAAGQGGPGGSGGGTRGGMFANEPVIARRGTPTPSYRAPAVDYKSLPAVELPALKDLPYNGLAKTPPMGWNSWNKFRT